MSDPMISVVTPCYNDKRYLPDCLESIAGQTYDNIEHIVVDGESTDGTLDLLDDWETKMADSDDLETFTYLSEDDDNMFEAIEKGFERASGDIYCWLNADDKWLRDTADIVSDVFEQTTAEWIIGHPAHLDSKGRLIRANRLRPYFKREWIRKGWYYGKGLRWIQQESTFWRRELWENAGGFPDNVDFAGEYWLWRQFAEEAELVTVDTVLAGFRHRTEDTQLSGDKQRYYSEVERSRLAELLGTLQVSRVYSVIQNLTTKPVSKQLE